MARESCRSQLVLDAWRRYVARKGRFSRPRPLRERMKRKSCHGSPPGNASRRYLATTGPPENAPRRNIATTCPLGTHGVDTLPRQGTPGICGRDMLPLPVGAALARCRDEGAGGARGSIDPSAASGASALRPSIGTCAAVFPGSGGALRSLHGAVCVLAPSPQGHGVPGSILGGDNRADFHGRGVGVPFQRLNREERLESALFRWATMRPFRVLRSSAVSCAEAKCALTFMLGAANVVKGMSWAFARQWEIWQAR